MAKGKNVTEMQDAILGQFKRARMQSQGSKTKRDEYIEEARKKKLAFQQKKRLKDDKLFLGGFDGTTLKEVEQKHAESLSKRDKQLLDYKNNDKLHILLLKTMKMFEDIDPLQPVNAEALEPLKGTESLVYDLNDATVLLKIGRTLSSSLKITATINYKEAYYRKADDFETSKQSVRDFRDKEVTINIRGKYGDFITFMRSIFDKLTTAIKDYDLVDPVKELRDANIWTFKFN